MAMHDDQVDVSVETVVALVREQFPRWGGLAVRPVRSAGTVSAIFRVGDGLAARFPLRMGDVGAIRAELQQEARAGAELAGVSPVPVPEPVALGEPGAGYPLPWSVQTWVEGEVASEPGVEDVVAGSEVFARDLASFVAALRKADTRGRTFAGRGRGGDIAAHEEWMETCFAESEGMGLVDVPRLRQLWARLRELPRDGADVMNHCDLIPGNVLVDGERLSGVLDGGGFGPADPALDLVGAWHLLERGPREVLRAELGCGDVEWERGKAWAFNQAMGLVWYYVESNPVMSRMGVRTLQRILQAEG